MPHNTKTQGTQVDYQGHELPVDHDINDASCPRTSTVAFRNLSSCRTMLLSVSDSLPTITFTQHYCRAAGRLTSAGVEG
jgi:hypothetical protein